MTSLRNFIIENLIGNEFDEKWEEVSKEDAIYKHVHDALQKFGEYSKCTIDFVAKVNPAGHYIVKVFGGKNGPGEWEKYLDDIKSIFNDFEHAWMIDLKNDPADDVWSLRFGIEK